MWNRWYFATDFAIIYETPGWRQKGEKEGMDMKLVILGVVLLVALVAYLSLKSIGQDGTDTSQVGKGCTGNCIGCKEHCSTPKRNFTKKG